MQRVVVMSAPLERTFKKVTLDEKVNSLLEKYPQYKITDVRKLRDDNVCVTVLLILERDTDEGGDGNG